MFMAMLLAASDVVEQRAAVLTWYDSYVTCMENQEVRAGAFNKLPPPTVVDIASQHCSYELKQFFSSFYDGETPEPDQDRAIRNFVSIAEGRAATAVIVSRTGSRGTRH